MVHAAVLVCLIAAAVTLTVTGHDATVVWGLVAGDVGSLGLTAGTNAASGKQPDA
jgi:hypothetical protein